MARNYIIKIQTDGSIISSRQLAFEGENDAIKLNCICPEYFRLFNKYIEFDSNGNLIRSPQLSNPGVEFTYLLPQNICNGTLKFQFVFINSVTSEIFKSQVHEIKFSDSINAIDEIVPASSDILDDFENRIQFLENTTEQIDARLDNEIQARFDGDLAINAKVDNYNTQNDIDVAEIRQNLLDIDNNIYVVAENKKQEAKAEVKAEIIGAAPEVLNTIEEIAAALLNNPDAITAINVTLSNKVDKVSGKGLSANDLTDILKTAYDAAVADKHTHANKATLDSITSQNKTDYDTAVTKAHEHTDLATLNVLTAIWKAAVDDVVSRLAAKWYGTDINLNQIGLTHLTATLQQLIGSNNNITNYPDAATIESFVENSINKLRIKDLGIDPTTKIAWKWAVRKGLFFLGSTTSISTQSNSNFSVKEFTIFIDLNEMRGSYGEVCRMGGNGYHNGFRVMAYNSTTMLFQFGNGTTVETIFINNFTYLNLQTVLSCRFSDSSKKLRIYRNGVYFNEYNITNSIAFSDNIFNLGGQPSGSSGQLYGNMYNVFMYNNLLTDAEVLEFYNNGLLNDSVIRVRYSGANNSELSSGLLIVGKSYKITARSTSDFTTVGAANNNVGTDFVATGIGTGLLDANNKVKRNGCFLELRGELAGDNTWIDSSGNGLHVINNSSVAYTIQKQLIQKSWTGNFSTNIAAGVANKDMTIPAGYMVEMIVFRNTLAAGNITNFQAIMNPASDNVSLLTGKTINNGKTYSFHTLADCPVDNVNNMTLRFNATGNGTGGIDIMLLLRRKD